MDNPLKTQISFDTPESYEALMKQLDGLMGLERGEEIQALVANAVLIAHGLTWNHAVHVVSEAIRKAPPSFKIPTRQDIEREIARRTIDALVTAGFKVAVYDGEQFATKRIMDRAALLDAMFSTDEDHLMVYVDKERERHGWVRFIYGNSGWDVICDHTTNLEDVLKPVMDWIEANEP